MVESQSVFITGASSGIGAALARHYAARGATLGLVARRADALKELVRELPGNHQILVADVVDAEALLAAGAQFMAQVGPPDIVIANAGISVGTLTEECGDLAAFSRVMDINVLGMLHTFHPFAAAIDAGASYTVFPWQMAIVAKLLRLLPNPVYDAIFARAERKPRRPLN